MHADDRRVVLELLKHEDRASVVYRFQGGAGANPWLESSGRAFFTANGEILALRPNLPVLLMSGNLQVNAVARAQAAASARSSKNRFRCSSSHSAWNPRSPARRKRVSAR